MTDGTTIDQILDVVGDDPGLAQSAKEQEIAERGDNARSTLLSKLDAIIAAAAEGQRFVIADGSTPSLAIPAGRDVVAITDRTTGRALADDEWEVHDGAVVKTAGGFWARGTRRWLLDLAE